jgi:hypothetical protein
MSKPRRGRERFIAPRGLELQANDWRVRPDFAFNTEVAERAPTYDMLDAAVGDVNKVK